jgi:hypothetical protein
LTEILSTAEFLAHHGDACSQFFLDNVVSWIVPILFAVVCIVGFFGNLLVIVVVIFYQQMRNTTNILILVTILPNTHIFLQFYTYL